MTHSFPTRLSSYRNGIIFDVLVSATAVNRARHLAQPPLDPFVKGLDFGLGVRMIGLRKLDLRAQFGERWDVSGRNQGSVVIGYYRRWSAEGPGSPRLLFQHFLG